MIKQYFYVYRITIQSMLHYYGARSTNVSPEHDIGAHYFSSSQLVNRLIEDGLPVRYKVVKRFNTFKEALDYEIRLHAKFDVENHSKFLNQRNQRVSTFCYGTKGKIAVHDKGNNVVFVNDDKLNALLQCGYKLGLPSTKVRKNFTGTFNGKRHTEESKKALREKKSINLTVEFVDGTVVKFNNRLELGLFLGKSPQLGARLVREHWRKDLWAKYNIKDIIRNEDSTHYENRTATCI